MALNRTQSSIEAVDVQLTIPDTSRLLSREVMGILIGASEGNHLERLADCELALR
jgi:hypothetical protein